METMRLLFLLLTIWTIAASAAWAQQPSTDQPLWARSPPPPPPPRPPPILATLYLTDPTNYPQFIENMRNIFSEKDKKGKDVLVCKMKKMSDTVPSPRYGHINIRFSATETVTLGIDRTNIYVLGYRDILNGNERAFFFQDEFVNAQNIFPSVATVNRIKLGYTGSYGSIGDRRTQLPLGIKNLREHITKIYGKATNSKNFDQLQRDFFLIAIQMVAEATRFEYMSKEIHGDNTLTVDEKVKALENGWGKLSKAIYTASTNKCVLAKPVSLDLVAPDKWTFNSVKEIEDVMGILKAKGNKFSENDDEDDDSGGVAVIASS